MANRFDKALANVNCRDFIFYAREQVTFDTLNRFSLRDRGSSICLDCDTALALSKDDLLEIAEIDVMPDGRYDLVVLREDPEQPRISTMEAVSGNIVMPDGISLDPAYVATSFRHWLRIHLYARSVTSNRLHSSIVSNIAGKPVTIGPGSYHKNRSVWEYCLREKGADWADAVRLPRASIWSRLPAILRNSYKVQRLRLAANRIPLK